MDKLPVGKVKVKTITLTAEQVQLLVDTMDLVARAIEEGKERVSIRKHDLLVPPTVALRNQSGWLRRVLVEQNGGTRIVTAWDYQEER